MIKRIGCVLLGFFLCLNSCQIRKSQVVLSENTHWQLAKEIEESVIVPQFPDNSFNVLDYGVIPEKKVNNAAAIAKAIEACNQEGGGKV
ncbi:MAG: glycoside hydrolase family 28 protein, partial [Saprospiraceae bacterium]